MSHTETGKRAWQGLIAWSILGAGLVVLVASFTGDGTGIFGWGLMAATMWLWMLGPLMLVVLVVLFVIRREERRRA